MNRYEAIVIEHGDGVCKHLYFIWSVTKIRDCRGLHRSLLDSGVRRGLDECYDAIKESFNDEPNGKVTITTIWS